MKYQWRTVLAAAVLAAQPLMANEPARVDAEVARVMVLGTFHFHNPGLDAVQFEAPDPLGEQRQAEILDLVDALAAFEPTRIAVERLPENIKELEGRFREWQSGERALGPSEDEQLGFRLAARFGHEGVWPFDHRGALPFGPVMEYARDNDPEFMALFEQFLEQMSADMNRWQQEWPLARILQHLNQENVFADDHALYLRIARVGAGTSQVGADLLSAWYDRNIRMFTNLQAISRPGDRVMVIVGNGHAPILRELVRADGGMELIEAIEYLPE
jgi:hypothetical protein